MDENISMRVAKFAERYGETENALRWKIFHAETNGLAASGAILKIGRTVEIIPAKYFAWKQSNPPRLSPPRTRAARNVAA